MSHEDYVNSALTDEQRARVLAETTPDLWWTSDAPEFGWPSAGELVSGTEYPPGSVVAVDVAVTLAPRFIAVLPEEAERDGDEWDYYGAEAKVFFTREEAVAAVAVRKAELRAREKEPNAD